MKIYFVFMLGIFSLSCKIFKKEQASKTNATLQPAGIKKGIFPLVVEQLGISNKKAFELRSLDPSEDMVLETVVWMQTYGTDVNVQFENPDKNFTRTEVEKIKQTTKACLYKTRMVRPMADVMNEQAFNLSKVEDYLKTPVENFNLEKPDALATTEEVELYNSNKSLWVKAKQDRNAMIQSYKKALSATPSKQPSSLPALSFYGKKRAITHFYESDTPILNIIRDSNLGLDKNGQPNYNVRTVPLGNVIDWFSNYTLTEFSKNYNNLKNNYNKTELTAYMDNLMIHQSLKKQLCQLRQKQPKMVNLENMTTAVLAGKYTPAGIYSMDFFRHFFTTPISESSKSEYIQRMTNFDKYYFKYLMGNNSSKLESIDKEKILLALENLKTVSYTGITIVGGDFLLSPGSVANVTTDSSDPSKERVSATSFLSKAILEKNLAQIQNKNKVSLDDFEICNPTNIEFMCL